MKITKKQLKRIIKEEKAKLIKEQWGAPEALSPLVMFAQAWAGLGSAVQSQMVTVVNGWIENNPEDVYEVNPNALNMAEQRLRNSLNILGQTNPDAEELLEAIEWAMDIQLQGDEEVERDARAAGDRQNTTNKERYYEKGTTQISELI